jgi:putative ABC transport system substrate-binding protein
MPNCWKLRAKRCPRFIKGLAEVGYTADRNVKIEYAWAEGRPDRLPVLAADLVRRQVAVIVTPGNTLASLAAKAATQSIPVVFMVGSDPVEVGLVASFNRPGANVTGVAGMSSAINTKRLALLHEMVPGAASIAMFVNSANAYYTKLDTRDVPAAARGLGVKTTTARQSRPSKSPPKPRIIPCCLNV